MKGWTFYKFNYYGGEIWKNGAWTAIQCFNRYYRPIGYSVSDETGRHIGYVRSPEDLP